MKAMRLAPIGAKEKNDQAVGATGAPKQHAAQALQVETTCPSPDDAVAAETSSGGGM
jgi:hypothetical protein